MVDRVKAGRLNRVVTLWQRNPDARDSAGQVLRDSYTLVGTRRGKMLPAPATAREPYTQGRTLQDYSQTIEFRHDPVTARLRPRDQIRYRRPDVDAEVVMDVVGVGDPAEERRKIILKLLEPQELDEP